MVNGKPGAGIVPVVTVLSGERRKTTENPSVIGAMYLWERGRSIIQVKSANIPGR
jgi:hypothetical protein